MGKVIVHNATFNNISVISGGHFYCWGKPQDEEKTIRGHLQTLTHHAVSRKTRHERDSNSQR